MAVGDLTSTVVRHKEQWTAVSNTKVSFGMNRGKTVKDRRIGVIETKPEPFDGGAAAGGAAAASSGSSSSSSSSSSAAAGGAAGGGDGTRHDSWALIRPELQEQLRSIGFRTAWEDVIDGHELARGVLRDRLRSVLVAFNKGALQKAEQVPAATESSISIVQALPAGVTLLTPEGFLATKGESSELRNSCGPFVHITNAWCNFFSYRTIGLTLPLPTVLYEFISVAQVIVSLGRRSSGTAASSPKIYARSSRGSLETGSRPRGRRCRLPRTRSPSSRLATRCGS